VPRFVTRTVTSVLDERPGLQRVELDDGSRAYVLTALIGPVAEADDVVVNTTAVDLGLGTGGWHVVHWNLSRRVWDVPGPGHVLKLRYTSLQLDSGVAEERHADIPTVLDGCPVVACGLHSQLAPVAVALRACRPEWRIAYVMTDTAALPLALSDLVAALTRAGFVDVTVTAGQAFGGDLEAVNVPSALTLARATGGADAIIVGMGPGGVGTATALGFGALEQAAVLDAVEWLDGTPIACLRYSDADARERHRRLSHHSVTVLARATHARCVVPVPESVPAVAEALAHAGVDQRHHVVTVPVPDVVSLLAAADIEVTTMGRAAAEEREFFAVAAAAGVAAASIRGEPGTVQV
jgi:Protein of unknown function (DUF3866)